MNSLQGYFLVASPSLTDPNFFKSVVLVMKHDGEGAFGVVLNRPTDKRVDEVWQVIGIEGCGREEIIYRGGPVPGSLIALHEVESLSEREILPGLYMAAGRDNLVEVVRREEASFRMVSGYSGWGEGQLEDELRDGGWLTAKASLDDVLGETEELWEKVSRQIAREMVGISIRPEHLPDDPSFN